MDEKESEDDKVMMAKLDEMKAVTMHEMIEEIETQSSDAQLLFLTGAQAKLIASKPTTMQKMLDIFCGSQKPQVCAHTQQERFILLFSGCSLCMRALTL